MGESHYTELVRSWSRALCGTGEHPSSGSDVDRLLHWLVADLIQALRTPHFDPDAGARVGAALAAAGLRLRDPITSSAPVLAQLAGLASPNGDPETGRRMAVLLAKLGEGYGTRRQMLFAAGSADAAPQQNDERFRVVFDNAAVAIAIGDTNGILLNANQALAEMIGIPAEELTGVSVYEFAHPEDRERIRRVVYERLVPHKQGTVKLEQQIGRADGSYGWAAFSITFVEGSGGHSNYLLAVGEDVTEQHRMREELHRQARHDPLTGVPNRRHLLEQLDVAIGAAGSRDRVGLCFVDLDRFKYINDRYGHGTGDKVLTAVARRLQASVQGLNCMVARIGGDEFVTLVPPPVDDDRMAMVADRLLDALTEPVDTGGHQLPISASIGAVMTPAEGGQAEALLEAADTGLYQAKNNGKAQWVLHTPVTEQRPERGRRCEPAPDPGAAR